jgi:uncharacterized repeat protein (TIGR01451 family)
MIKKILFAFLLLIGFQSEAQFSENFESGIFPPAGWTVSDNGVGVVNSWISVTSNGNTSAYINRENIGYNNTSEDWLVTPPISIAANGILSFFGRQTFVGDQGTFYEVKVSTTSPTDHSSFTTVDAWTESDLYDTSYIDLGQKIVPLTQYQGQNVYVAFVRSFTQTTTSLAGDRWLIDYVSVTGDAQPFNSVNGSVSYSETAGCANPLLLQNSLVNVVATGATSTYYHNGNYSLNCNNLNTDVVISSNSLNPYFEVTPPSYTFNFPDLGHLETANFCLAPVGVHPDLSVGINRLDRVRPGMNTVYRIVYHNSGNQVQSGTISLEFEDSVLDYVESGPDYSLLTPFIPTQSTNNLNWNFSDLHPFETKCIYVMLHTNSPTDTPPVNDGDILPFTVTVTPVALDETPANNSQAVNFVVNGPFDPNVKEVMEGSTISMSQASDYLHYIIRFQNIGTAPAINVKITDNILDNLDINTLQVLGGSHDFATTINGNRTEFIFNNINLPAASTDEQNSHGFVTFMIKPKNTVGLGSVITNSANIYFDYNFPITTNTTTTTVTELGTGDFEINAPIKLYPNPALNSISIELENRAVKSAAVYNMLGQIVQSIDSGNLQNVDISGLESGIYMIIVNSDKGKATKKFIKL